MKLEEILPEIRKGRRFKRKPWKRWQTAQDGFVLGGTTLVADDYELEPEIITDPVPEYRELSDIELCAFAKTRTLVGDLRVAHRAGWDAAIYGYYATYAAAQADITQMAPLTDYIRTLLPVWPGRKETTNGSDRPESSTSPEK